MSRRSAKLSKWDYKPQPLTLGRERFSFFGLHFHFQRGTPYFIRPEGGGWQLHLGFMTITREIPKISN